MADDRPDDCMFRVASGAASSALAGTIVGAVLANWGNIPRVLANQPWPALKRTGRIMFSYGATFTFIGVAYTGVDCVVEHIRGKKDVWNGVLGGAAAGAVLGLRLGRLPVGTVTGARRKLRADPALVISQPPLTATGLDSGLTTAEDAAASAAEITAMPYFDGPLPSKQYGGLVPIDPTRNKRLYYWFVQSERNPSTDPVLLWLNGGPGCASTCGLAEEIGPFTFQLVFGSGNSSDDPVGVQLSANPNAWSKVANVLFLDSPSGVGLSYSDTPSDYSTSDQQVFTDTYAFLRQWFTMYPSFQASDFYIGGESYGGIYVPTLAQAILDGNGAGQPAINLKGYLVGNPATDPTNDYSITPLLDNLSIIPDRLAKQLQANNCQTFGNSTLPACGPLQLKLRQVTQHLNMYNALLPCFYGEKAFETRLYSRLVADLQRQGVRLGPAFNTAQYGVADLCFDDRPVTLWLNDQRVRAAIHAAPIQTSGFYVPCTTRLNYTSTINLIEPYHLDLISRGLRALIYSGDHDLVVPHTGTEAWTAGLGLPVVARYFTH
ncbi:hypothetical protein WJX72_000376 [[Myrmecia] bisecta]|uniref:Carboxypeptidase n=1 Tax=[Myrmecia] bisecta TaxID=41462 RepID=A0AAW1Q014_9CHLO